MTDDTRGGRMADDLLARADAWLARHDANPVGVVSTGNLIRDLVAALRLEQGACAYMQLFSHEERVRIAEGQRDEARALLREARTFVLGLDAAPPEEALLARIDAHLRGEGTGGDPDGPRAVAFRDAAQALMAQADRHRDELLAERDTLLGYLRQHAITHDPTVRPMWSTCNICEAQWGGEDEESHGPGCPFHVDAARQSTGA